jgi:hypothetical protein
MTITTFAKGLSKYRFDTIEQELAYAWDSIYRYWWFALRCSRDYWWVCQEQGKTLDPRLNRVYNAFGDVHNRTFSDWWRDNAREKFKEGIDPPIVTRIYSKEEIDGFEYDNEDWMLFKVPQGIKESKLLKDFASILRSRRRRKDTITPTAQFPINKHRNLQLNYYKKTFSLWLLVEQSGELKKIKTDGRLNYYDLGVQFYVNPKHVIKDLNDPEKQKKRNAMKVAVHRLLAKADALIANAEIGIFPSETKVEPKDRWNPNQLKRLEKAIADGAWKPKLMTNNEWAAELMKVHEYEQANRDELDLFAPRKTR